MRILHIIPALDPNLGGPPRVAARLAAGQAALGHEVSILTYAQPGATQITQEMLAPIPHIAKVRIEELPPRTKLESLLGREAQRRLAVLMPRWDVLHLHGVWETLLRVAAKAARRCGRPYFVQPDGMLDPWCLRQRALKKKLALALSYRTMLERAAGLVLGNDDEVRLLEPLRLRTPQVVAPLNGVFPEEMEPQPAPGQFAARVPALRGEAFAVFLGRLHYKKGLDFLADAFALVAAKLPSTHLVVIGHDGGAQAAFEAKVAAAGLQARVHMVGPLHGQAKWEAYRDASCFVLPSRQEGFSIAITEALACGLPVVISRECHFDEVSSVGAGLVVELNAPAVAAGMLAVLTDPARRAAMSAAARRLIAERYTCPAIAQQLVAAYEQALPATRARSGA